MPQMTEAYGWQGRTILANDGEKIGNVSEIYLDQQTEEPEWATVAVGALGGTRFVPLAGAVSEGDTIRARVTVKQVQDAPSIDADRHVSEQEEARLFEHYGIPHATEAVMTTQGQSGKFPAGSGKFPAGSGKFPAGTRLRRYVPAENLTPVVGSVRTTRWTTADDRAGADEPAAGKSV